MADLRSPATTTNHYAKDDPSAVGGVHHTTGNVATLGHPANGVTINEGAATTHHTATTAAAHGVHHGTTHHAQPVATTTTQHTTTTAAAAPAARPVHTVPSGATGDGLAVASNLGGPLGGAVVLGGQCECTRNGGKCAHGAGQCSCRGCTTAATSLNPGINIGVSTHQYTAPVGTSGIGGGVADPGVGMAGVVNPTNTIGAPVTAAQQNCDCIKRTGACQCAPGQCSCTNCAAHRKSLAATQAAAATAGAHHTTTTHHTAHHTAGHTAGHHALGGSEYVGGQAPNYTHSATTGGAPVSGGITGSANSSVPITDNSNVPYKASDYTEGKPVNSNSGVI